jgi:hypothetical protein
MVDYLIVSLIFLPRKYPAWVNTRQPWIGQIICFQQSRKSGPAAPKSNQYLQIQISATFDCSAAFRFPTVVSRKLPRPSRSGRIVQPPVTIARRPLLKT